MYVFAYHLLAFCSLLNSFEANSSKKIFIFECSGLNKHGPIDSYVQYLVLS